MDDNNKNLEEGQLDSEKVKSEEAKPKKRSMEELSRLKQRINSLKEGGEPISLPDLGIDEIPKPKQQNIWLKLVFLLLNVAVVAVLFLVEKSRSGYIPNLLETIKGAQNGWKYILLAFSMFLIIVLSQAGCFFVLIAMASKKFKPWLAVKVTLFGKYYDSVTPFSMGGQPFQMYYMRSKGIDISTACSTPLIRQAVKLIAVDIAIIVFYCVAKTDIAIGFKIAASIGVGINLLFPAFIIFVALNKNAAFSMARWVLKLGVKFKIVKNYDKTVDKLIKQTDEFVTMLKFLGKHFLLFVVLSILSLTEVLALVSVPYFVLRAFGYEQAQYFDCIVRGLYAMYASSYVPTPGASGGAEAYFYGLFGGIVSSGNIFWGVMLWRFITYYIFLVVGNIMNFVIVIKNSIKTGKYNHTLKELMAEVANLKPIKPKKDDLDFEERFSEEADEIAKEKVDDNTNDTEI